MRIIIHLIVRLIKHLLSFLPSKLPVSGPELSKLTKDVLELGNWPSNDANESAVATMILHLPMERVSVPKRYFYRTLRRSVTNQIAYATMELIKQRKNAQLDEASLESGQKANSQVE